MSRGIHYMLSHPPHGEYLVVSIRSLRKWWDGPVYVYGWPHTGAWEIVESIGRDARLGIEAIEREPKYYGERDHLIDKIAIMEEAYEHDCSLLLDADTIISGKLDELFEAAERSGYVVAQFCNWLTTNGIIRNRVKRLLNYPELDLDLVRDCMETPYPSPNVGVFACVPGSPVMPTWREWTMIARTVFIPDESVMQALFPYFSRLGQAEIIDGRWNCSTMRFQSFPDEEIRVWHGHGNGFLRPRKAPKGHEMWWNLFMQAREENLGGIMDWPKGYRKSRYMKSCLKERGIE